MKKENQALLEAASSLSHSLACNGILLSADIIEDCAALKAIVGEQKVILDTLLVLDIKKELEILTSHGVPLVNKLRKSSAVFAKMGKRKGEFLTMIRHT
ncbi:MAG TPA: hypothetical protein VGX03_24255, partial [Candidatus Binatia bacterium]|nr:hypothetical protein [Candidatus Binatia bacterium]